MSKNVLFYFSGTGNSLAVARNIAGNLTDALVVPMLKSDAGKSIDTDTERIGLVYPIYMNTVPRAVVKFIKTLRYTPGQYVFAVATHMGLPGKAGLHLGKLLEEQQINLNAYFQVEMINNTPKGVAPKPLMSLNWEEDITADIVEVKLSEAKALTDKIAEKVKEREANTFEAQGLKVSGINYWLSRFIWSLNENSKTKLDFILDESCTGCGLCERVCTTNRIKLMDGKPKWTKDDCNYCYACFNFCPAQAIGVKHYTKKLGRYHHPDVTAADIAEQMKDYRQEEQI